MESLDDPRFLARHDPDRFLSRLDSYVDDFADSFRVTAKLPLRAPPGLKDVTIAGMGGSGIGGNLVASLVRGECPVPIKNVKDYHVPAFVGPKSLVFAVSYSGQTEETLCLAEEALERGARLIVVSTGGPLRDLAAKGATHLSLPAGYLPRAALPHLLGTLLGSTRAVGLTAIDLSPTEEQELRSFHATMRPDTPQSNNPAKRFAADLHSRYPVWYAAGPLVGVGLRARCQLNENAKMLGRNDELPEANHNELVAWDAVEDGDRFFVGFLRQKTEPREVAARFDFVERVLVRRGVPHRSFVAEGSTPLVRILQALLLVDYVSVYAAALRGVDPTPVPIISELKSALAGAGADPPALAKRRAR